MAFRLQFRPKYDKIVELLLYLVHQKPDVDHYAASKYVYLADRNHFNKYFRPITFDRYGAMPWGPVALKTYELLKQEFGAMHAAGITSLPFKTTKVDKIIYLSEPERAANLDLFSETDLEEFDEVLREYGHLSMPELHELTMQDTAYKKAWDGRPEGSRLADIDYEDILVDSAAKEDFIEDIAPISHRL